MRQRSIKGPDFLAFLANLRERSPLPLAIILDNCSVHKTHRVREYMAANDMEPLFLRPYSPQFNGIELLWARSKPVTKKIMTE